jgi:hypothetical protein
VGGSGANGGYNGGGVGGGGGASDIRYGGNTLNDRVIVAGAGGGGAGCGISGGAGGTPNGGDGGFGGGSGATTSTPGSGVGSGQDGALGIGGNSGNLVDTGGGSGLYGGGGNSSGSCVSGGGGGGGSSLVPIGASVNADHSGNGEITLSWLGSGTSGVIPVFGSSNSLLDSFITQDVDTVYVNSTLEVTSGTEGDSVLRVVADTDNNDENDNPRIDLTQDGGTVTANVGLVGDAGQIFTNSLANAAYFRQAYSAGALQLATNGAARLTVLSTGLVGIGTNAPTTAMLDVAAATHALRLRAGGGSTDVVDNQILMSYDGTTSYTHAIKTRHNSGSPNQNAIDFYVWNQGVDAVGTVGTQQVFTVDGANTGSIGVNTGTNALTANLVVNNSTSTANIVLIQDNGTPVFTIADGGATTAASTLAVQGASVTVGGASQLGSLILHDGNGQTITIQSADQTGNQVLTIPITAGADTFCLETLANCTGGGGSGIEVTGLDSGDNSGTSATTASIAVDAGDLVLVSVANFRSSGSANTPSLSGLGITWSSENVSFGSDFEENTYFWGIAPTTTSGTLSITFGGQSQTEIAWTVAKATGHSPTTPIVQSQSNSVFEQTSMDVAMNSPANEASVFITGSYFLPDTEAGEAGYTELYSFDTGAAAHHHVQYGAAGLTSSPGVTGIDGGTDISGGIVGLEIVASGSVVGGASEWTDGGTFLFPADLSGAEDIVIGATTTGAADIWLQATGAAVFNEQGADADFRVEGTGQANALFVQGSDGFVGIGTGTPGQELDVNGQIRYIAATADNNTTQCRNSSGDLAGCTSLAKFKDSVKDLNLGLSTVLQLNPVRFDWNSMLGSPKNVYQDLGFIAEEVAQVNPLLARYNQETGELEGVRYSQMTALLTEAVQEQQSIIDSHASDIHTLKAQIASGNDFNSLNVSGKTKISELVVNGTARVGKLLVEESATVNQNLTVKGKTIVQDIQIYGKIITSGDKPKVALGEVLAANDSVTIKGNDSAGTLTIAIGQDSEINKGDTLAKVTFSQAYDQVPRISLTGTNLESTTLPVFVEKSAKGFILKAAIAAKPGRTYKFDYIIVQ